MAAYDHPNLVRFIYIDAFNYLDDFVTHLVTVAIRLRNAGVDDRNILWHLSESIVGSIYRGTEHSTIYEGQDVYKYFPTDSRQIDIELNPILEWR